MTTAEPYTTEGDDRLRERIRLAPSTLSTAGPESAYRYHILSADSDIIDVAIDCPIDEPNTVNIYPLMTGGAMPTKRRSGRSSTRSPTMCGQ